MSQKVLVGASDSIMQRSLGEMLSPNYEVLFVGEGRSVAEQILIHPPALVILDQIEACERIRQQCPGILIIMLSTETREKHIVHALDLGADDYVVKPFSTQELSARVRALLRRASTGHRQEEPEQLASEDHYICLNATNRQTYVGGHHVSLSPTEFALLWQLVRHAGKVLTHRTLLQAVWGPEYGDETDYLRVYVRQIRRKIEQKPSQPCYLLTETGVGYVFRC